MLGKVTVGLFFLLLVWGNAVAGLKAGLGCPDWPLCHGRVVPPFRWDIYMEFGHRVIAAAAAISLAALAHFRFRAYKGAAKAVPLAAVGIIAVEIVLGGLVVLTGLPVQLTTVHFMTGLVVFVLALYMMSFDGERRPARFSVRGAAALFLGFAAVVFFQAALGAYVRHSGSGLACPDFPTCLGMIVPRISDPHVLAHYSHRLLAYLLMLTMLAFYASTVLDRRMRRNHPQAVALLFLVGGQIAVGAVVVLSGLYFLAAALHLAVALAMLLLLTNMWAHEVNASEVEP